MTGITTSAGGVRHPPYAANEATTVSASTSTPSYWRNIRSFSGRVMNSTSGAPIASTATPSPAHQCATLVNQFVSELSDFTVAPTTPPAMGPATSAYAQ